MAVTHDSLVVALHFEGKLVPRSLTGIPDDMPTLQHFSKVEYEQRHVKREKLLKLMAKWEAKLERQYTTLWESGRRSEINLAKKRFRKTPDIAVGELERTYRGCLFLLEGWDYLRTILDTDRYNMAFPAEDHLLFLDLCGTPIYFRAKPHEYQRVGGLTLDQARAYVREEIDKKIARLTDLAEHRRQGEEDHQKLAAEFPGYFPDRTLRRLHQELFDREREIYVMSQHVITMIQLHDELRDMEDAEQSNDQDLGAAHDHANTDPSPSPIPTTNAFSEAKPANMVRTSPSLVPEELEEFDEDDDHDDDVEEEEDEERLLEETFERIRRQMNESLGYDPMQRNNVKEE